jgi:alpha-ribazole phosphatase
VSDVTRLVLVRHAEPDESVRGLCYGALDVGLSSRGERQARALAWRLAGEPLAAVYSSPSTRASATAHAIGERHGLEPCVEVDLREIDFGAFEGRTYAEIQDAHPEIYAIWMRRPTEVRFPGGESFAELRTRVLAAMETIVVRHAGSSVALVGHGGPNRAMLAHALGVPDDAVFRIGQDHGRVSEIRWDAGRPTVVKVNA